MSTTKNKNLWQKLVAIFVVLLGLVSPFISKAVRKTETTKHKTLNHLYLSVNEQDLEHMRDEGGTIQFENVHVNGRIQLRIEKNPE